MSQELSEDRIEILETIALKRVHPAMARARALGRDILNSAC